MDVSPQTIREVEFREKLRGYHQDDVDEFLERVASGVEVLQERLRQVSDRAVRAEEQARETLESDESLRRTLVLAQRTADIAVQEARDEAARIVAEARGRGEGIVAEATEAARRLAEEAQAQIWADVGRLEAAREQLRDDVVRLTRYLDDERARVQAALADVAANMHDVVPAPAPPPGLHDPDLSAVRTWPAPRPSGDGTHDADVGDAGAAFGYEALVPAPDEGAVEVEETSPDDAGATVGDELRGPGLR